ncbi:hypothetical protein BU23DRAFT_59410 [Bimuria novae-zelandiae CBS 107.79]|uniref:Uncharacterized protein n=1 Tax=Bimuria novae-zelandiae CBS 107.79 TaxID=1447943 RepID=A0A6A5VG29_9PLEO|nr:hypothetical protein BU23DRAFT_59410 [Bimuria novae-zelandiae CBS 107.79]
MSNKNNASICRPDIHSPSRPVQITPMHAAPRTPAISAHCQYALIQATPMHTITLTLPVPLHSQLRCMQYVNSTTPLPPSSNGPAPFPPLSTPPHPPNATTASSSPPPSPSSTPDSHIRYTTNTARSQGLASLSAHPADTPCPALSSWPRGRGAYTGGRAWPGSRRSRGRRRLDTFVGVGVVCGGVVGGG